MKSNLNDSQILVRGVSTEVEDGAFNIECGWRVQCGVSMVLLFIFYDSLCRDES